MSGAVVAGTAAACAVALRLAMAFILAEAAVHALRDRGVAAAVIADYRIVPGGAAAALAVVLPLAELGAAVLLLIPAVRFGAVCAAGLFGVFAGAMAVNLWRGRDEISCGCGGGASLRISWALVARNAVLIAVSGAVALAPGGFGLWDLWAPEMGFAVFLITLYFAANQLIGNAHVLASRAGGARA